MSLAYELKPHYTYQDYKHWEGRWELIEGEAYAMSPAPLPEHQKISNKIGRLLDEALDGCTVCSAYLPIDWKIAEDTVVQPDNLVLCYEPEGSYIIKAPSLVFEVISPSTATKDEYLKFILYEREGVPWYVLVYPDENRAKIYRLQNGHYIKACDATDETFTFELDSCSLSFDFAKIWG